MKESIIKRFHAFHWGQFLVSKIQFVFTLLILIKVYDFPLWLDILIIVGGVIITQICGEIWVRYFKKSFHNENYRELINNNQN
jgi:hypothetical protein